MSRRNTNKNNYRSIFQDYENNELTVKQIGDKYKISHMTVYRIVKKYKNDGDENHKTNVVKNQKGRSRNYDIEIIPSSTEIPNSDKKKWEETFKKSSKSSKLLNTDVKRIFNKTEKRTDKITVDDEVNNMINIMNEYNQ